MSQGSAPRQADLFRDTSSSSSRWSDPTRSMPCSRRECHALFPDELFADLFAPTSAGARCRRWSSRS